MGIAEVIPGVSGGTIAFITGIYERLLNSIRSFGPEAIKAYRTNGVKGVWSTIDGTFLFWLLGGMVGGLAIGVVGVTYLIEHFPEPLWSFFFGLILASCIYIGKMVPRWDGQRVLALVIGAVFAFGITVMTPAEGSSHPFAIYLAGVIAISALILPGISGSFMLLIMGMYHLIIPSIKTFFSRFDSDSGIVLLSFGLGALTGLVTFSRVLGYLFKHFPSTTFALLTGFMIGSLRKIWPWHNVSTVVLDNGESLSITSLEQYRALGEDGFKVLKEANVLPTDYWMDEPRVFLTIIAGFIGFGLVWVIDKASKR